MAAKRGLSPRLLAQLNADLRSGRPIAYRRLGGTKARFYNPDTGQEVSEHYVRIYNRSIAERSSAARNEIRFRNRSFGQKARRETGQQWQTYQARQQALGRQANEQDFLGTQAEFNRAKLGTRHQPDYHLLRDQDNTPYIVDRTKAPDSDLANLLVSMGRRLVGQDNYVGTSPEGWIENHVLPAFEEGRVTVNQSDIAALDVEGAQTHAISPSLRSVIDGFFL